MMRKKKVVEKSFREYRASPRLSTWMKKRAAKGQKGQKSARRTSTKPINDGFRRVSLKRDPLYPRDFILFKVSKRKRFHQGRRKAWKKWKLPLLRSN